MQPLERMLAYSKSSLVLGTFFGVIFSRVYYGILLIKLILGHYSCKRREIGSSLAFIGLLHLFFGTPFDQASEFGPPLKISPKTKGSSNP